MSRDITPFDPMDRMFDQMRRSMAEMPHVGVTDEVRDGGHVRVEETDDGYLVVADVPRFEREELTVRFDDGMLHITGEHRAENEGAVQSRRVDERVRVPDVVAVAGISASYRHGVLEVSLPVEGDDADGTTIDIE